jgi:hypothetical protein
MSLLQFSVGRLSRSSPGAGGLARCGRFLLQLLRLVATQSGRLLRQEQFWRELRSGWRTSRQQLTRRCRESKTGSCPPVVFVNDAVRFERSGNFFHLPDALGWAQLPTTQPLGNSQASNEVDPPGLGHGSLVRAHRRDPLRWRHHALWGTFTLGREEVGAWT